MRLSRFTAFANYYLGTYKGLSREIWLLTLICLVNRAGTIVIAFLSIYLTDELGFEVLEAGYIMAAYGAGSLLGNYTGGVLTDRVGYFKVQVWSLFLGGLAFILLYHIKSFYGIMVCIFIANTISETFRPANMASFAVYSKPENLSRSVSLQRLSLNLGYAVGPALGGLAIKYLNYQWVFYVDGLTYILAGCLLVLFLRPKERRKPPAKKVVSKPLEDIPFVFFCGLAILVALIFMQLLYTIPLYCKDVLDLDESQIGLLMTFNGLLIVLIEMPIVYEINKRNISVTYMMALGAALIAIGYTVVWFGTHWVLGVVLIFFLSIGEVLNFPLSSTFTLSRSPKDSIGQYSGMFGLCFSIGFMLAPLFGTYMIDAYGFEIFFTTLFIIGCFLTLGYIFLGQLVGRVVPTGDESVPKQSV